MIEWLLDCRFFTLLKLFKGNHKKFYIKLAIARGFARVEVGFLYLIQNCVIMYT